ncbi:FG-GAP repeat domain-containing protein [Persicimonas caeni]|nr:VCBS repeat-containing protein [Persicimonas caeni]
MRHHAPLIALAMLLAACNSEPDARPDAGGDAGTDDASAEVVQLSGSVQKGPFVLGSSVDVAAVDAQGTTTGEVFSTQTSNDLGEFEVSVRYTGLASIEASGFYYNEVRGNLSSAELTLRSFADIQPAATQTTYVNILTHLSHGRVDTLLDGGLNFADARQQAETELVAALAVGPSSASPGAANELSILGGDTDANAYLFAVSTIFTQAAKLRAADGAGSTEANLQELLNQYSADFAADGQLDAARADELVAAERAVDTDQVEAMLAARLQDLGSTATVPDLDRFIDTDGDGIVNADDPCVLDPSTQPQHAICAVSDEVLVALETTTRPYKWWAADFDGDGEGEIVTVAISASLRYIDRADDGTFTLGAEQRAITVAPGENVEEPRLLDYDDDGDLDIIAVHTGRDDAPDVGAIALQNDGAGQFTQVSLDVPTSTWSDGINLTYIDEYTAVDLDGDGLRDLVVRSSGRVGVILAQQGGGWSDVTELDLGTPTLRGLSRFAVTDLDADADLDVLISAADEPSDGEVTGAMFALINDGDGEPQVMGPYTDGLDERFAVAAELHTGDFNADGHTDALLTTDAFPCEGQCTAVMYGDGAGAFGTAEPLPEKATLHHVDTGDFNGDAVSDLLVAGNQTDFLLGASGGLAPGPTLELDKEHFLRSAQVVDLDADGRSDIVTVEDPTGGESLQLRGWYFEGPASN